MKPPVVATFYRTANVGAQITPVQVTKIMPTHLTIVQEPNGALESGRAHVAQVLLPRDLCRGLESRRGQTEA